MDRAVSDWSGLMTGLTAVVLSVPLALSLGGCGEEEPPPPPPPPAQPPPPPPPPPPEQVDISSIMRAMGADARVAFPQDNAPYDASLAEAVIGFAGALLDPDDPTTFGGYLDDVGKAQLDEIDLSVGWFETVEPIEGVRVVGLEQDPPRSEEADSATVLLAVQEADGAYLVGWTAVDAGGWVFSGLDVGLQERARASEFDGEDVSALAAGGGSDGPAIDVDAIFERAVADPLAAAFLISAMEIATADLPGETQDEVSFDPEDDRFNEVIVGEYGSVEEFEDAMREAERRLDDGEQPAASDVIPALQVTYVLIEGMGEMMAAMMGGLMEGMAEAFGGEAEADEMPEISLPPMVEVVAEVLDITDEEAQAYIDEGAMDEVPTMEQLMQGMMGGFGDFEGFEGFDDEGF